MEICKNFYGYFLNGADYISKKIQQNSEEFMWDGFVQPVFDKYINKQSKVLEIGSNIGAHTVYLSQISNHVTAFEPQQYIYYQLCGNLFINKCMNVTAYNLGVYDKECFISPDINIDYTLDERAPMVCLPPSEKGTRCVTIDSLNENFSFIKIDAQGADLNCLEGGIKTIEKYKPVILLELEHPEMLTKHNHSIADYFDFYKKIDYHYEEIAESNFLLTPNI